MQTAFAPADIETAELLSRITGQRTVSFAKRSLSGSTLALTPRRATVSLHEVARPLLTAEEVRRLPDGEALVFVAGHAAHTTHFLKLRARHAGKCRHFGASISDGACWHVRTLRRLRRFLASREGGA